MAIASSEPWNQQAIFKGVGVPIVTDSEIWKNNPEKVFGVTRAWAEKHPNTHLAMLKALIRAGKWLDENNGANRKEAAQILSRPSTSGADYRVDRQQHDRHVRIWPRRQAQRAGLQRVLPLLRDVSVLQRCGVVSDANAPLGADPAEPDRISGITRRRRRCISPSRTCARLGC